MKRRKKCQKIQQLLEAQSRFKIRKRVAACGGESEQRRRCVAEKGATATVCGGERRWNPNQMERNDGMNKEERTMERKAAAAAMEKEAAAAEAMEKAAAAENGTGGGDEEKDGENPKKPWIFQNYGENRGEIRRFSEFFFPSWG